MIEHHKNQSLNPIVEEIDGVLYTEEWKSIDGYEGLYEISNFGRVKSLEFKDENGKTHSDAILRSFSSCGYRRIGIVKNKKQIKYQVHRLVAIAFVPNNDNLPQVNHKKGVRWDNRAWMLEWSTCSDNHKHAFTDLGKQANTPWKGKSGEMHFGSHPVLKVSLDGFVVNVFGSKAEAGREYNVTAKTIINYINKNKPYRGYYLV